MPAVKPDDTPQDDGPQPFAFDADLGSPGGGLPADVLARIRATPWHTMPTDGKGAIVEVHAPAANYPKSQDEGKGNVAYDVKQAVNAALAYAVKQDGAKVPEGYVIGTKRTTRVGDVVRVGIIWRADK